jgi:hypothetical protein
MFVGNVVAGLDGGGAAGKIPEPDAAVYAACNAIVEPVIGQIKQARGFRQFLLGGWVGGWVVQKVHGYGRWWAHRTTFRSCTACGDDGNADSPVMAQHGGYEQSAWLLDERT